MRAARGILTKEMKMPKKRILVVNGSRLVAQYWREVVGDYPELELVLVDGAVTDSPYIRPDKLPGAFKLKIEEIFAVPYFDSVFSGERNREVVFVTDAVTRANAFAQLDRLPDAVILNDGENNLPLLRKIRAEEARRECRRPAWAIVLMRLEEVQKLPKEDNELIRKNGLVFTDMRNYVKLEEEFCKALGLELKKPSNRRP